MNLVIVESPTKARTIRRFLGKDYEIKASMGHVMDLPKSTLGVAIEDSFTPQFELMPDKKRIVDDLKRSAKTTSMLILATDPDREGEAIAYHVAEILKKPKSKTQRIVFHEITSEAIEDALKKPRGVDMNLVDAQTARRVLDRLVGYKLSPILWKKIRRGLSAGRVQSVALRVIVEREREIEKFKEESYYSIIALLRKSEIPALPAGRRNPKSLPCRQAGETQDTEFELVEINNDLPAGKAGKIEVQEIHKLYHGEYTVTKTNIQIEADADRIVKELKDGPFVVSDILQKEMRRSPQPPYTTSTLQQDGARRLGFPGRRTMMLAQKLYEEGFITYHRTDSVIIATSAQNAIMGFIKKEFGEKYLPEKPRFYSTKQKLAQEAHEAIRPTKVGVQMLEVGSQLTAAHGRLYDLIWKRAVASQMADAVTESTTVLVDASSVILGSKATPESDSGQARMTGSKYRLKANGSVLVFDGFLKINPQALQDNRLPDFKSNEELKHIDSRSEFHETQPPPRYNDASLIKALEEEGIGRPSTYATIISTIEDRRYIERLDNRFTPTTVGIAVNDFLVTNFADIDDIPFTAEMEDMLDDIASGKREWQPEMKKFYAPFEKQLKKVKDTERVKIEVEESNEICEKCGSKMVVRIGRFGRFLSCSTFPECDFTKQLVEDTGVVCPQDGGKVIVRKTRKGRIFYGCSNYPACKFAVWKLEDIKKA